MEENRLYHGADYNPEQWLDRPDILEQDIELMKKARINVVSLGIFAWSTLEPREGEFHFDWMTEIIDRLYAAGISVILATPSGARPAWMAYQYPEIRRVDANRVRQLYGMRQNHCYTSPVYRDKVKRIDQKLAQRFGKHPGVILWHISNEFGGECHCPLCQAAFQNWLKKRYGTLDALNEAWNTKFWAHDYTEWSQIESPAPHGEDAMQGLKLDWKRFVSHQTLDFCCWERDCIREVVPDAKFTTNMMYRFDTLDYFEFAKELDLISWDNYPTWHKAGVSDTDTAIDAAMMHDLFYSLKGKPFWMLESTPSATNWQPVSKVKKPGMQLMSSLQAIAHGADAAMYFQWRQSPGAFEKFHGSVVAHDGREDNRVFQETSAVGKTLERLAAVSGAKKEKQAAIVHDWSNKWALEGSQGPRNAGMGYWEEMTLHYSALARMGVTVDFVNEDSNLEGYQLVIAPMLYLLREDFAQKLRDFTVNGGTLVVTYWSGVVDEHDQCWLGDTPHGLTDVFGLRRTEIDSMYDGETRQCIAVGDGVPRQAIGGTLCEIAMPVEAEPLMIYNEDFFHGSPAVTRNAFGKGCAYYLATRFDQSFYQNFYKEICANLFQFPWPQSLPAGILATMRGDFLFLQNTNDFSVPIEDWTVPPFGTVVWQLSGEGQEVLWSQRLQDVQIFPDQLC